MRLVVGPQTRTLSAIIVAVRPLRSRRLGISTAPAVIISAPQVTAGILLYRQRLLARWHAGDWLILYLPPIVAAIANIMFVARDEVSPHRMPRRAFVGVALAVVVWYLTMLVNLNVFGS